MSGRWHVRGRSLLALVLALLLSGAGLVGPAAAWSPPDLPDIPFKPPAAPSDLRVEEAHFESWTGLVRVHLTFRDNADNEEGFKLERRDGNDQPFAQVASIGANTTSIIVWAPPSKHCAYRVYACNAFGNSGYSNVVQFTTPGPPVAPSDLTATVGEGRIELSWTDNSSNETGFRIMRRVEGESVVVLGGTGLDVTWYVDHDVVPGVVYIYYIYAFNSIGTSPVSNAAAASVLPPPQVGLLPDAEATPGEEPGEVPPAGAEKTVLHFYINRAESYVLPAGHADARPQVLDAAPIIREGRTLLPIRYVAEPLGATVSWDPAAQKATVALGENRVELWIGRHTARVNGVTVPIDPANPAVAPLTVPPGRTMLPLRFIAEVLGCRVDWNATAQEVKVTYPRD